MVLPFFFFAPVSYGIYADVSDPKAPIGLLF